MHTTRFERETRGLFLLLAVLALVLGSCSTRRSARGARGAGPNSVADVLPSPIELRTPNKRPPIQLVQRDGDPHPAVALALVHPHGSIASAALAGLLRERMGHQGFDGLQVRVHDLGLIARAGVGSAREAEKLVQALSQTLAQPVSANDPTLQAAQARVEALAARRWVGSADAHVRECAGEAGIGPDARLPERAQLEAGLLESWRAAVHSPRSAAFAAVGSRRFLDGVARAVASLRPWPDSSRPRDTWPEGDTVGSDEAPGVQRISVALRTAAQAATLEAADALGLPDTSLLLRLRTIDDEWQLTRVTATLRPRGACLRVDLEGPAQPTAPLKTITQLTAATLDEAQRALAKAPDRDFALELSILENTDPRDVAGTAAWQVLVNQQKAGPRRRHVAYVGSAVPPSDDFATALSRAERQAQRSPVEVRSEVETGQGELWALLASPCGTVAETTETAGLRAIALRALADAHPVFQGVSIEPWITPDGVGLLAHGPRRSPDETALQHADRVGDALGRVLAGEPLGGDTIAQTRDELATEVGPGPRPSWWLVLAGLAPEHTAWLEPRGTWQSISAASTRAVTASRHALLAEPLRMAVLASFEEAQGDAAVRAAARWLGPFRSGKTQCPQPPTAPAQPGIREMETTPGPANVAAHLGVRLPQTPVGLPAEAYYTVWLLNREGGWLDRALRAPSLAASARAELLGGSQAAALVVTLDARQDQTDEALAQLRALFQRIATGTVTPREARAAEAAHRRVLARSALSPRRRIVDLWRATPSRAPTLESLRRYHARAFAPDRHVAVVVRLVE